MRVNEMIPCLSFPNGALLLCLQNSQLQGDQSSQPFETVRPFHPSEIKLFLFIFRGQLSLKTEMKLK
jgi:hypothetical protein